MIMSHYIKHMTFMPIVMLRYYVYQKLQTVQNHNSDFCNYESKLQKIIITLFINTVTKVLTTEVRITQQECIVYTRHF